MGQQIIEASHDWWMVNAHDVAVIELLDGAAHPRPEGDGWIWCESSEQVLERFKGRECEISCGPYIGDCVEKDRGCRGIPERLDSEGDLWLEPCTCIAVTSRGGAWVRAIETSKTPERLAADAAEIAAVEADDRATAAREDAEKAHRVLRDLRAKADEADARARRAAEDARWPLPEGWEWRRDVRGHGCLHPGVLAACGGMNYAVWADFGDLCIQDLDDGSWGYAPIAVVEAVIARYRAEREESS